MVKTRGGKQAEATTPYTHVSRAKDLIDSLIEDMSEHNNDPDIIVPNEKLSKYESNLSGNSLVLVGPANSGKNSQVQRLSSYLEDRQGVETHFINVDCRIYESDAQFLQYLTRELRVLLGENTIAKHIMINETTINLPGLNKELERLKKKELVLVIRYAQILAGLRRKQRILYNIFQWINNSQTRKYITVLVLTHNIVLLDHLDKRIRSRMNLPIIYLSRPRPAEVLAVILRRIDHRASLQARRHAPHIQKLRGVFVGNRQLERLLEEQYEYSPQDITYFLKVVKLILTLDIQDIKTLESLTPQQLASIVYNGFRNYSKFLADYKSMARHLFLTLATPEVILLGMIRQYLINQDGVKNTELNLRKLARAYTILLQRRTINELGTAFRYGPKVLEDSLLRLQDQNFVTVAKISNIELPERNIISQYSPEDLLSFYRELEDQQQGLPAFVQDLFTTSMIIE